VKKIFFLLLFLVQLILSANAQKGGLVVLKDRGIIVRSFTVGSYINFKFINHQWITGYVDWIKTDSIQISQFALQTSTTAYGTWAQDTLKMGTLKIHVNEITGFAHDKGHYTSVFTNGALLKIGGPLYMGLNMANSLIKKDQVFSNKNLSQIGGGLAAWLLGVWQSKLNPNYRPIGKRFSVEVL
jgi:hypothetical protein